jgi:hypothetical protein
MGLWLLSPKQAIESSVSFVVELSRFFVSNFPNSGSFCPCLSLVGLPRCPLWLKLLQFFRSSDHPITRSPASLIIFRKTQLILSTLKY